MKDFQEAKRIERYRQKDRHEVGKEATSKYPRLQNAQPISPLFLDLQLPFLLTPKPYS